MSSPHPESKPQDLMRQGTDKEALSIDEITVKYGKALGRRQALTKVVEAVDSVAHRLESSRPKQLRHRMKRQLGEAALTASRSLRGTSRFLPTGLVAPWLPILTRQVVRIAAIKVAAKYSSAAVVAEGTFNARNKIKGLLAPKSETQDDVRRRLHQQFALDKQQTERLYAAFDRGWRETIDRIAPRLERIVGLDGTFTESDFVSVINQATQQLEPGRRELERLNAQTSELQRHFHNAIRQVTLAKQVRQPTTELGTVAHQDSTRRGAALSTNSPAPDDRRSGHTGRHAVSKSPLGTPESLTGQRGQRPQRRGLNNTTPSRLL